MAMSSSWRRPSLRPRSGPVGRLAIRRQPAAQLQPQALFGFRVPGIGAILTVVVIFLTGLATRNFVGQTLVKFWEGLLERIPIVRSIYSSVKQVSDTVLSPNGQAFRKAMLVQYPRAGVWTIAFQTGSPADEVRAATAQDVVVHARQVVVYQRVGMDQLDRAGDDRQPVARRFGQFASSEGE